jgi:imidazoleglycerol-phosphate dehydratase
MARLARRSNPPAWTPPGPFARSVRMSPPRRASIRRETSETRIVATVDLDGSGTAKVATGIGFLDHMLTSLARHAMLDIELAAEGDLHVDAHHTTEDTGIVLGQAIAQALGEKRGIRRFGAATVPMDEALAEAAVDVSGRPYLAWDVTFPTMKVGEMDTELFVEWFRAFATNAGITLHVTLRAGANSHHIAEACFKALARALRAAVEPDPRAAGAIPSTKGSLVG